MEGWVTIRHGKPTVVNHFWEKGGMALLSTMSRYTEYLPNGFVSHLLEVRRNLLPGIAVSAASASPEILLAHLGSAADLDDIPEVFVDFDWDLQVSMVACSGNPIYLLLFNDFASMFKKMAARYFRVEKARKASLAYYRKLHASIDSGARDLERIVRQAMQESIEIWKKLEGA
jgi:GntR family negative regulator for fad regulon and positive regulator of fabA